MQGSPGSLDYDFTVEQIIATKSLKLNKANFGLVSIMRFCAVIQKLFHYHSA